MNSIIMLLASLMALCTIGPVYGFSSLTTFTSVRNTSGFNVKKSNMTPVFSNSNDNTDFWEAQKKLAESMSESDVGTEGAAAVDISLSEKQKYNESVNALVFETFYFGIMFFSAIWYLAPNPFTAISYFLGALLGSAYCYGLGKYVSTLGGSAYNPEDVKGSGVGSARFAFLIVLFIFVGKFRSEGLQEIPAIMGFFTYQVATLSQGLKDASE